LTSRERLLTVLDGMRADRVPISTYELVGYNGRAWENNDPSYARLMDDIRRRTDCVCMWDPLTNSAIPRVDHIGDFLDITSYPADVETERVHGIDRVITRRTLHTPRGDLTSESVVFDNLHTVWRTEHWCKSLDDVDRILSVPFEPVQYDFSDLERIEREVGDRGIIMSSVFDALGWVYDLMEFGQFLVWAFTELEHFEAVLAEVHDRAMENLRRMLGVRVVDLYRICGAEAATPPYMPRRAFERYVVPFDSEMVDLIHSRGARARIHCHGKIGTVLDLIAATGTDSMDPCEAPPDGDITLEEVKRRVGDRMCLFGNIQLKLLEHGTQDEVRSAVRECIDAAGEGGGYVLMPTAAPINTPLSERTEANYRCYINEALDYGRY